MRYVIDIHANPPCVVLVSDSLDQCREVGQRYADQVRRDLVVAVGPRADDPDIRPTIAQAPPPLTLELVPVAPSKLELARTALAALKLTNEEQQALARELE